MPLQTGNATVHLDQRLQCFTFDSALVHASGCIYRLNFQLVLADQIALSETWIRVEQLILNNLNVPLFTLDKPISTTIHYKTIQYSTTVERALLLSSAGWNCKPSPSGHWAIMVIKQIETLQMGLCGSRKLTRRLSHLRSKWTIFFEWRYSMPHAASIAIISLFLLSSALHHKLFYKSVLQMHALVLSSSVNVLVKMIDCCIFSMLLCNYKYCTRDWKKEEES